MKYTHKQTVFNQIFYLVRDFVRPLVGQQDKLSRKFSFESLLKVLLFAQTTGKESLRDIETWLQAHEGKLYHLNIDSIARSTISYRNNKDNNQLYEKLFYSLYEKYKSVLLKNSSELDLWIKCIALDGSLITVALSTFDRAKYRTTKWWIKMHLWLEVGSYMPRFCVISDGKKWETAVAKELIRSGKLYPWEMIVFDRWYVDFSLWKLISNQQSSFITRTKTNLDFITSKQLEVNGYCIIDDKEVQLLWAKWVKEYPEKLRVVRFYHQEENKEYEYITNNFELSAEQIADIYKSRREIETFFRWIKQNLKIKSFLWTSENAVKNQIWIALIYFLILKYLTESVHLWKQQILKFMRLISEKIMDWIGISELYVICKSKTSRCISNLAPPVDWLFS
jgi:Transposase DDE domain/Domain of unknown function (DUF4372)